ncbi:hypothetical protein L9F63_005802, partial [Diploptera punctata]
SSSSPSQSLGVPIKCHFSLFLIISGHLIPKIFLSLPSFTAILYYPNMQIYLWRCKVI